MKKITLAFTLLTALATTGTAFADHESNGYGRAPVVDHRAAHAPVIEQRDAQAFDGHGPVMIRDRRGPGTQAPFVGGPQAPAFAPARWDLLANRAAFGRRGKLELSLPRGTSYDQLRLVASERGLDILSVELTYARGRKEIVQPARDGLVAIDVGRGKLAKIEVRYVNRGASRGASIKLLGKDDGRMTVR